MSKQAWLPALALATALAAPTLVSPALAQAPATPPAVTMEQARRIATEQGMSKIEEIELDDGTWEVEGRDAKGAEMDIDIRASDGTILKIERDGASPARP